MTEEEATNAISDYIMSADGKVHSAHVTNVLLCAIVLLNKSVVIAGRPFTDLLVEVLVEAHGMCKDHDHKN